MAKPESRRRKDVAKWIGDHLIQSFKNETDPKLWPLFYTSSESSTLAMARQDPNLSPRPRLAPPLPERTSGIFGKKLPVRQHHRGLHRYKGRHGQVCAARFQSLEASATSR